MSRVHFPRPVPPPNSVEVSREELAKAMERAGLQGDRDDVTYNARVNHEIQKILLERPADPGEIFLLAFVRLSNVENETQEQRESRIKLLKEHFLKGTTVMDCAFTYGVPPAVPALQDKLARKATKRALEFLRTGWGKGK